MTTEYVFLFSEDCKTVTGLTPRSGYTDLQYSIPTPAGWEPDMGLNSVDYDFDTRTLALKPELKLIADKKARAALVAAITVTTTAGNTFDGNEEAQRRMTSAITAMTDTDLLPWILYNNTVIMASKAELIEALRLAGMQMASIWITPYTG